MRQRRRARVQVGVRGKEAALTRGQRRSHSVSAPRFSAIKLASSDVSDSISLSQAVLSGTAWDSEIESLTSLINFIKRNGAAPSAAKSALQRSRLYWHQLWRSFELHER